MNDDPLSSRSGPARLRPSEAQRICVAKIATAHGIKGLVKLHVFVENTDLLNSDLFTAETGNKTLKIKLKNATAKHWLAEIDGVTDRTEAEKLRGTNFYINKDTLPEPNEGEVYINDLIGLPCIDEDETTIGKVIAFQNFGAGDLLDIQPSSNIGGGDSFYLPMTDDTVLDIQEDKIIVAIPEGLRE